MRCGALHAALIGGLELRPRIGLRGEPRVERIKRDGHRLRDEAQRLREAIRAAEKSDGAQVGEPGENHHIDLLREQPDHRRAADGNRMREQKFPLGDIAAQLRRAVAAGGDVPVKRPLKKIRDEMREHHAEQGQASLQRDHDAQAEEHFVEKKSERVPLVVFVRAQRGAKDGGVKLRERGRAHERRERFHMKRQMEKRNGRDDEHRGGGGEQPGERKCGPENFAHAVRFGREFADEDVAQTGIGEELEEHREREDERIRAELRDADAARDEDERAKLQQPADAYGEPAGEDVFDDPLRLLHRSQLQTPPAAFCSVANCPSSFCRRSFSASFLSSSASSASVAPSGGTRPERHCESTS